MRINAFFTSICLVVSGVIFSACHKSEVTDLHSPLEHTPSYIALATSANPKHDTSYTFSISDTGSISNIQTIGAIYNSKIVKYRNRLLIPVDDGLKLIDHKGSLSRLATFASPGVLAGATTSPNHRYAAFAFQNEQASNRDRSDAHIVKSFGESSSADVDTSSHPLGLTVCNDGSLLWVDSNESQTFVASDQAGETHVADLDIPFASIIQATFDCNNNSLLVVHEEADQTAASLFGINEGYIALRDKQLLVDIFHIDVPGGISGLHDGILLISREGKYVRISGVEKITIENGELPLVQNRVQSIDSDGQFLNIIHLADSSEANIWITSFLLSDLATPLRSTEIPNSSFSEDNTISNLVNGDSVISSIILLR